MSTCKHLFVAQGDKPMTVGTLEKELQKIGNLAGIEHVHPHRFRHTFAINQLLLGTSEPVLMQLMGHESPEALRVYMRALKKKQAMKAGKSVVDTLKHARSTLSVFYE
jgi:integrase